MSDRETATSHPSSTSYASSIVALVLGIVLAVGVSAFFGVIGWGGEWASQVAGATSGAAPLIIDGVRQRRRRNPRDELAALRRGRQIWPRLLIASIFGFAVLLLDSVVGLVMYRVARAAINLAHGDQDRFVQTYTLLGIVTTLPYVIAGTFLLAIAAGHRLGEASRRWILLGIGIYAVMRIAILLASGPSDIPGFSTAAIVAGVFVTLPLMAGVSLLGARRARRTQAGFYARIYLHRLPPEDRDAALALLDETAAARRA